MPPTHKKFNLRQLLLLTTLVAVYFALAARLALPWPDMIVLAILFVIVVAGWRAPMPQFLVLAIVFIALFIWLVLLPRIQ